MENSDWFPELPEFCDIHRQDRPIMNWFWRIVLSEHCTKENSLRRNLSFCFLIVGRQFKFN